MSDLRNKHVRHTSGRTGEVAAHMTSDRCFVFWDEPTESGETGAWVESGDLVVIDAPVRISPSLQQSVEEQRETRFSHDDAKEAVFRFMSGRARTSIPVNKDRDDDCLLIDYIERQREQPSRIAALAKERDEWNARIEALEADIELLGGQLKTAVGKTITGIMDRNRELKAIVAKLPVTADDKPIVRGMTVWVWLEGGEQIGDPFMSLTSFIVGSVYTMQDGDSKFYKGDAIISDRNHIEVGNLECYSTEAAALAARNER